MKYPHLVLAMMLGGCATIGDMRDKPVRATYVSARSQGAIESCLAGKLGIISAPIAVRGESSTELAFGRPDNAILLITLMPQEPGTKVEVRARGGYTSLLRHRIEGCV